MSRRKRFEDMSTAELLEYEKTERYAHGRADAFNHGTPATIKEYWNQEAPTPAELLEIVYNLLGRVD